MNNGKGIHVENKVPKNEGTQLLIQFSFTRFSSTQDTTQIPHQARR